jgi:hypothetical protein
MRFVRSKSLDEVSATRGNFSAISIVLHMDESARRHGDEIG